MTKLKVLIDRSGYKQRWLASAIGMDETLFSKIVQGVRPLSVDARNRIAKLLKVKRDEIEGSI